MAVQRAAFESGSAQYAAQVLHGAACSVCRMECTSFLPSSCNLTNRDHQTTREFAIRTLTATNPRVWASCPSSLRLRQQLGLGSVSASFSFHSLVLFATSAIATALAYARFLRLISRNCGQIRWKRLWQTDAMPVIIQQFSPYISARSGVNNSCSHGRHMPHTRISQGYLSYGDPEVRPLSLRTGRG